jgi:exodeoxyribonuclease V alpha subunit
MESLRCVVERITYHNADNGYTVIKVRARGFSELVTIVGSMAGVNVGCVLIVRGQWKNDGKYGRQFVADNWEETLPATIYGIEKYLGSGLIKGIGPIYAKKIVALFSEETLNVIEERPDDLIKVEGIGEKRVSMIKKAWLEQKEIKNLMLFLTEHGLSTTYAIRIYKEYGDDCISIVRDNPYRLADDIWGIGFMTADTIAQKLGFEKDSYARIRGGIIYTLGALSNKGHCYANREQLIEAAFKLLKVDREKISTTIDTMVESYDIVIEEPDVIPDAIYIPPLYYSEIGAANRLGEILRTPIPNSLSDINEHSADTLPEKTSFKKRNSQYDNQQLLVAENSAYEYEDLADIKPEIEYSEAQQEAIKQSIMSKVLVITGGPGTGKTTTILGIISMMKQLDLTIILAAPTGRAAKRMSEACNFEAKTIHRLLGFKPPSGYEHDEDNPLRGDVLIIDECSMIDIVLLNSLLKAVPNEMKIIFVGDIDQLPSVGPGNVLSDMITSNAIPVIKLNTIFRQAYDSDIIKNAHLINKGKFPQLSCGKDSDFFYIEAEDNEQIPEIIVNLCKERLPKFYRADPFSDIQVISPMARSVNGTTNLNAILQTALNPNRTLIIRRGLEYKQGDKVMQVKNNYDKNVFNGDIGIIQAIDPGSRIAVVEFDDREVEYDTSELDELVLSYAITIHKSQGSEYPIVVMPLTMQFMTMLQRNLLYTGITRAKKAIILVGSKKAISCAVENANIQKRNTGLSERLSVCVSEKAKRWNRPRVPK